MIKNQKTNLQKEPAVTEFHISSTEFELEAPASSPGSCYRAKKGQWLMVVRWQPLRNVTVQWFLAGFGGPEEEGLIADELPAMPRDILGMRGTARINGVRQPPATQNFTAKFSPLERQARFPGSHVVVTTGPALDGL